MTNYSYHLILTKIISKHSTANSEVAQKYQCSFIFCFHLDKVNKANGYLGMAVQLYV